MDQYGATLKSAIDPLETELADLAKAKAYKGLQGRVDDVKAAVTQAAAKLRSVTPPAEAAGEHTSLVSALGRFESVVGGLGGEVGSRHLCTGATVRAKLGDADGTGALRSAMAAVQAKLPGERRALTLPSVGQKPGSRPSNGALIRSRGGGGNGRLTIDNSGGSDDALVTLGKGGKPMLSVFVRHGKKHTVNGVPDGAYTVFFTGGTDWDGAAKAFGRDCAFQKFEDPLEYTTTRTATQIRYSTWRITLQEVVGGNARTSEVNPDDFPG
ncbi:hypothetical protein [Actinomadura viridis]|uniref:Uncharacterized protein n=1 Tax=Actinomadura viridis TaxID=58110 RepID=A0A931D7V8_9ACTN|nr:hypothetical protein [Actinomadura viridis]MBG6086054.1 hypothetical protein [Actinomadura viridis]